MRLFFMAVTVLWAGLAGAAEIGAGRLTVTGVGRIDSAPDMATITLGVVNEAELAADAMAATSGAVSDILKQLAADGLAPRDMQTRDLSLSPVWNDRRSSSDTRPEIVGFQASNTVVIRVRDLAVLGGVLDRTIESGANLFQGLSFGLQDPGPDMDEARRAAVAEALRLAELFAGAAGIALGPVLELTEGGGGSQPMPIDRMAMAEAMPIAEGEVTTAASVTMVFAIEGAGEGAAE